MAKKKGFFSRLFDKLDERMEEKSKQCSCKKSKDECCK